MTIHTINYVYGFLVNIGELLDLPQPKYDTDTNEDCESSDDDDECSRIDLIYDERYKLMEKLPRDFFKDDTLDEKIKFFNVTHDVLPDVLGPKFDCSEYYLIVGVRLYSYSFSSSKNSTSFVSKETIEKEKKILEDNLSKLLVHLKKTEPDHLGLYHSQDDCACCS